MRERSEGRLRVEVRGDEKSFEEEPGKEGVKKEGEKD